MRPAFSEFIARIITTPQSANSRALSVHACLSCRAVARPEHSSLVSACQQHLSSMGDRKADPRTVFVRGVDASMSDAQLQELFGEVGPVKHAFLVRKGGKDGAHRGFGFVQFAVTEDAERAAADLNGKEFAGRKLKVRLGAERVGF